MELSRRTLLGAALAGATVTAGCSDGGTTPTETEMSGRTDTASPGGTETPTEGGSTTAGTETPMDGDRR